LTDQICGLSTWRAGCSKEPRNTRCARSINAAPSSQPSHSSVHVSITRQDSLWRVQYSTTSQSPTQEQSSGPIYSLCTICLCGAELFIRPRNTFSGSPRTCANSATVSLDFAMKPVLKSRDNVHIARFSALNYGVYSLLSQCRLRFSHGASGCGTFDHRLHNHEIPVCNLSHGRLNVFWDDHLRAYCGKLALEDWLAPHFTRLVQRLSSLKGCLEPHVWLGQASISHLNSALKV
jgi:hypothetical protein